MKKILFLLLLSVAMYGQVPSDATPLENIQITNNVQDNSTDRVNVPTSDGVINWKYAKDLKIPTKAFLSTGLLKNGLISINADPTKFNVSAGIGIISNFTDPENPVSTIINFPAFTAVTPTYLTAGNITYIAINSTPAIVMQASPFTPDQRRDLIVLGAVVHSNLTNINVVNNISAPSNAVGNQLHDFIEAVGALNLTGNKYSANGANLALNKSAGTIFKFGVNFATDWKNPHELSQSSGTALTFRYRTQDGTEGTDRINLNPALYDLNNVLTTVPNNKFTIQTVTMFQTGLTRIQYGQNVYDDIQSAQAAIFTRDYNVEANIKENGITRAYIIVKNNATSLQNTADSRIVEAQKFGGIASGGVALTFANVVAALGYTPENIANKSNSYTASSTTSYPNTKALVDGLSTKQNVLDWKTPQDYGAIGDGTADDTEAIQNCFAENLNILLYGTYKVTGVIDIRLNQTIFSNGAVFEKATTNSSPVFRADNASEWSILGRLQLLGDRVFAGGGYNENADGILIIGGIQWVMSGVTCQGFAGSGFKFLEGLSSSRSDRGLISDCQSMNNSKGVYVGSGNAQYMSFVNMNIRGNVVLGAEILSGNTSFTGGNIGDNNNGVYIGGLYGQNNSHGIVNGVNINHNDITGGYNIRVENAEFGQTFSSCHIYGEDKSIEIVNSKAVSFNNCIIDGGIDLQDTSFVSKHYFSNCQIEPLVVLSGLTENLIFKSCFTRDGSFYSGNSDYNLKEENVPLNSGYTVKNNFNVWTNNPQGTDIGGSLGLGGEFHVDGLGNRVFTSFGTISGRKKNNISGSLDAYISLKVTTDAVSPYSIEEMRIEHSGTTIRNLSGLGNRAVVADENGKLSTTPIDSRPYKIWAGTLNQSGTSAPSPIVYENTIGDIVWTRITNGMYWGTLTGAFPEAKTYLSITPSSPTGSYSIYRNGDNVIVVQTKETLSEPFPDTDGKLFRNSIEIRVYNFVFLLLPYSMIKRRKRKLKQLKFK